MYKELSSDVSWIKVFAVSVVVFSLQSSVARALPINQTTDGTATTVESSPATEPITERCQLLAEADQYAIDHLGFEDVNENGIPDYRETYRVNLTDCSTVSAQFDWILEQMAKNGVLNPDQGFGACQLRGGRHAANFVPEIGIVDITPSDRGATDGHCWYQFPDDTRKYPVGFPDLGEILDPAYGGMVEPPPVSTIPTVVVTPSPPVAPQGTVIVRRDRRRPVCKVIGCIGKILRPRKR